MKYRKKLVVIEAFVTDIEQEKKDVAEQDKHDKPDVAEVIEVEYTRQ